LVTTNELHRLSPLAGWAERVPRIVIPQPDAATQGAPRQLKGLKWEASMLRDFTITALAHPVLRGDAEELTNALQRRPKSGASE
jgi:hypothetical protein